MISFVLFVIMVVSFSACAPRELSIEKLFGVNTDITVEQKTIYDENGIKVVTKGMLGQVEREDRFVSTYFYLQLEVENTTKNKIFISSNEFSTNGIMLAAYGNTYVEPGATAELNIDLCPPEMERCGISLVKEMEFSLLYGAEGASDSEYITTDPIVLTTSADQSYVQPAGDEGVVVYSGDEAKIVLKMTEDDDIRMYVENKLGQTINVLTQCVSVNGESIEDYYENNNHVVPGKKGYSRIAYPRDLVDTKGANTFGIQITICDDSGDNLAFVQTIKDLGTVTVTLSKES
jgi:hypothetical protein